MAPSVFAQCGAQHLVGIQQALVGGQVGSVPQIFLKSYVVGSVWGTTVAGTQTGMVLALVGDLTETFGEQVGNLRWCSGERPSLEKEAYMWSLKPREGGEGHEGTGAEAGPVEEGCHAGGPGREVGEQPGAQPL